MSTLPVAASRARRGEAFIDTARALPIAQEASLELPLGFPATAVPGRPVAVILHAFHVAMLPEIAAYLQNIPFPADLFISTDAETKRPAVEQAFAGWTSGTMTLHITPNRGRDIGPKLVGFAAVHDRYEYVLHLHTKQSVHDDRLVGWRGYLLQTLLGSPETVHGVFAAFAQSPRLGLLAPQHIELLRPWIRWSENHAEAEALAARMGFPLPPDAPLDFPSGSMFWARTAALRPLLDLKLGFDDFPAEHGQTDGTLAHAIERLYFLVCEQAGYDWIKITARGQLHDRSGTVAVSDPQDLARFLSRRPLRLSAMRDVVQPTIEVVAPSPRKPRRVLHPLWARALGDPAPVPPGEVATVPLKGQSRNEALQAGFATGAALVLLLDGPVLLHPGCTAALARMARAHGAAAVIEAACVPNLHPNPVDPDTLAIDWAGGPTLALTRTAFEATGGYDEQLTGAAADQDLSRRARAQGCAVLHCARALFYPLGRPS